MKISIVGIGTLGPAIAQVFARSDEKLAYKRKGLPL